MTYFGRNGESYCDMVEHTQVAEVHCRVSDMVEGVCSEVSKSALRRKTKHIMLETARGAVKLPTKLRPQSVKVGDHVTVYVPDYASVYEVNGSMVVCEFYGFEVIKGKGE